LLFSFFNDASIFSHSRSSRIVVFQIRENCQPNTVTFNSLIKALGQGAQWEKAQEVVDQMRAQGCNPDVVTYTALISALGKGGQWYLAVEAFETMRHQGCRWGRSGGVSEREKTSETVILCSHYERGIYK